MRCAADDAARAFCVRRGYARGGAGVRTRCRERIGAVHRREPRARTDRGPGEQEDGRMATVSEPAAAPVVPVRTGTRGRDLTTGPIGRTLLLFALPTLASNILQSLNGSINAVWVGRFLGESALAATSNANLVMFLMFGATFGFAMAATILIGQHVGARDVTAARRVLGTAIGAFVALSAAVALVGWIATPAILRLLATPADVQPLATAYLRVIFLMMPASFLTVLLMMGLRGFGDSLTPLWFMALSVVLDSGLNPVFILGLGPAPRLGIAGAAVATLIASYASLAALIATIYLRDLPIRLSGPELGYLRPRVAILRTILVKGLPMGLQMIVVSLGGLVLIGLVNRHGTVTTAAYGVTTQLWAYVQMPALALGAAVSAMVAQNIGAGRWDRVDQVTRAGVVQSLAITGAMVVAISLADRAALGLFLGPGSPAIGIAAHIHRIAGWSFMLLGAAFVLFATVRANGSVLGPLLILAVAIFPIRLGFIALMTPRIGVDAIWWGIPAGFGATLIMAIAHYRLGGWRRGALVRPMTAQEAEDHAMGGGDACGKLSPAR